MSIIQGSAMQAATRGFYPKTIEQSLRFNNDDSAYLSRTPASEGDRKTWTWSGWVKRGNLGQTQFIMNAWGGSSNDYGLIGFLSTDVFYVQNIVSNVQELDLRTNRLFRDASAWYHIVLAVDSTQATPSNRAKLYVNGIQETSFGTETYMSQNNDTYFNDDIAHNIGRRGDGSNFFDGYLAEVHFTDGTAYDADDFGEFKEGVWVAKTPDVTYGTNGFHLEFAGNANDSSGNGNNWTENNITSDDYVSDSPTDNFATLNPLMYRYSTGSSTFSDGNLTATGSSTYSFSTFVIPSSGQWYFEVTSTAGTSNAAVGIGDGDLVQRSIFTDNVYYLSTGSKNVNGSTTSYGSSWTTGDVIGVAVDADADTVTFYKNNVSQGAISYSVVGKFIFLIHAASWTMTANFGQQDFDYTPPTDYLALSTANLPDPAIDPAQGDSPQDYFNTVLYTGNGTAIGSGGNAITGVGFQPDLVWIKERSGAASHGWYDVVRGVTEQIESDTTAAETTESEGLTAFGTDGFTVGSLAQVNTNTDTYVAWNWKANGSGVSNTDGTITSTVSANTESGFSIVSYTGNNTDGATVGHGLNQTLDLSIVKSRDNARNWSVKHSALSGENSLFLNLTNSESVTGAGNVTFDATDTFTLNDGSSSRLNINGNSEDYIAYCFHSVEGFSKFGSYTGNGSADGPFVYTGFRPAFVLTKRTESTSAWYLHDTVRNTYNVVNLALSPDLTNAEVSANNNLDILSNGFKLKTTGGWMNASGGSYIYMTFAENPFKYSNAR